ncbi:E6 [Mus musculus papillomavirus type 1]|uniref:Protein E6 n=1 Tax=Mus musculus papillomavirus type 1 TaxID=763552 RepID=F8SIL6_9PAPI|nr:E6 [Mus musculus papillomavirus type 1]
MEIGKGYTLEEVLRYSNKDVVDFHLSCAFCSTTMDHNEKARFLHAKLKCVVRDFAFKGACIVCRRQLACKEKLLHTRVTGEADLVECMAGKNIVFVTVRCVTCLALLTASEKLDAKACGLPFHLVRHMWRGYCGFCKPSL